MNIETLHGRLEFLRESERLKAYSEVPTLQRGAKKVPPSIVGD